MTEQEILAKYSTPGLRKFELTRAVKREHLLSMRMQPEAVELLLEKLYEEPK